MSEEYTAASLMASYPPALSTPLHILIVDDEKSFAELMERQVHALQDAFPRAVIEVVHDWTEAIRAVQSEPPPSVTLLDLKMPGPGGELLELREAVKHAIEFDERTAVVIVSGHRRSDIEELLVDSRIEVLHKDESLWKPGNVIRALVRAMERKSLAEEKGRFSRLRGIVDELKSRGYATPETQL